MAEPNVYRPGPDDRTVIDSDGKQHQVPAGWQLLPPGDAGLTRRVKAAGDHWVVKEKRGRRTFSRGVWAPAETIELHRRNLDAERSTEGYAKKQQAAAKRREKQHAEYVNEFTASVLAYLNFADRHQPMAEELAKRVAAHATPVGSGTVARTKRISVEDRAEAAVIAWMRHHATAYDDMVIPRQKGKRREVRRELARYSRDLLEQYREGGIPSKNCVLREALDMCLD